MYSFFLVNFWPRKNLSIKLSHMVAINNSWFNWHDATPASSQFTILKAKLGEFCSLRSFFLVRVQFHFLINCSQHWLIFFLFPALQKKKNLKVPLLKLFAPLQFVKCISPARQRSPGFAGPIGQGKAGGPTRLVIEKLQRVINLGNGQT